MAAFSFNRSQSQGPKQFGTNLQQVAVVHERLLVPDNLRLLETVLAAVDEMSRDWALCVKSVFGSVSLMVVMLVFVY